MHRLVAFLLLLGCASVRGHDRPNVVVILTDDAGYADFGFTGCDQWQTPNIDRLAETGVVCEAGYVSAAVCSPSRAGLLTGLYQQRFGHEFNLAAGPDFGLPVDVPTIADLMRDAGYVTGAIGKWHLGAADEFRPKARGFDEFYGYLGGSRSYFSYDEEPSRLHAPLRDQLFEEDPADGYVTEMLSREAAAFIERHAHEPFFLYVSYTAVHGPMHARPEDLARIDGIEDEKRRTLAAMTLALDRGVGQIMDALEATGRAGDTLIFFLNDNGGATNNASDNGRYRGMKGSKFEGGVRVPFVVRWPARLEPGRYDEPVISLDILPTALGAAGAPPAERTDGVDLVPFLTGERDGAPHGALFWRRGVAAAVRAGDWKLVRVETIGTQLFDLGSDLSERSDVSRDNAGVVAELSSMLEAWEGELAEPLWREAERWTQNQIRKHRRGVTTREQERRIP